MGYIITQTSYNDTLSFGPYYGESISQSFFFHRNFQLNAVNILFGYVTLDPGYGPEMRMEVRRAYGDEKFLNLDLAPIKISDWVDRNSLISYTYNQFVFDRSEISSGTYFFSLVTNKRIRYPIYLSYQNTGAWTGYFIKLKDGYGEYSHSKSLTLKIDGVWGNFANPLCIINTETYMQTTIQDLT